MKYKFWVVGVASAAIFFVTSARSQVYLHGQGLPLVLATQAANVALQRCAEKGFPVSVAVVDPSGQMRVFLKSDQATVHTKDAREGLNNSFSA